MMRVSIRWVQVSGSCPDLPINGAERQTFPCAPYLLNLHQAPLVRPITFWKPAITFRICGSSLKLLAPPTTRLGVVLESVNATVSFGILRGQC
jgi:hypothetical protein